VVGLGLGVNVDGHDEEKDVGLSVARHLRAVYRVSNERYTGSTIQSFVKVFGQNKKNFSRANL
jgi:hypothetical protein